MTALKTPWHTVDDPDGPTEIRNASGKSVGEISNPAIALFIVRLVNTLTSVEYDVKGSGK